MPTSLRAIRSDITKLHVDAIVNAAASMERYTALQARISFMNAGCLAVARRAMPR